MPRMQQALLTVPTACNTGGGGGGESAYSQGKRCPGGSQPWDSKCLREKGTRWGKNAGGSGGGKTACVRRRRPSLKGAGAGVGRKKVFARVVNCCAPPGRGRGESAGGRRREPLSPIPARPPVPKWRVDRGHAHLGLGGAFVLPADLARIGPSLSQLYNNVRPDICPPSPRDNVVGSSGGRRQGGA